MMSTLYFDDIQWVDWKIYLGWINQPKMMRLLDRRVKVTEAEHRRYLKKIRLDETQHFFAVKREDDDTFLGVCALRNIDKVNRKAELYICLNGKNIRGKGYGKQAVELLLDYGFDILKLNRIYLYTPSYNAQAIRCYKSVGFVKEGEFRDDIRRGNQYFNAYRMCYLKSFRKKRGK